MAVQPWAGTLALLQQIMVPVTRTLSVNGVAQYARRVDLCNIREINADSLTADSFTSIQTNFGDASTGELALGINSKGGGEFEAFSSTLVGVQVLGNSVAHAPITSNVLVGFQVAFDSLSLANSVYVGAAAASNVDSAAGNVGIGWRSHGAGTCGGSNNVFVGAQSGFSNLANANVFLGYQAGCNITSGASNVFIGTGAGTAYGATTSNTFVVNNGSTNPLLYGKFGSNQLGIGKVPATGYALDVSGDIQFSGTLSGAVSVTVTGYQPSIIINAITNLSGIIPNSNLSNYYSNVTVNAVTNLSGIIPSSNLSGVYSNATVFFSNVSQRAIGSFYSTVSQTISTNAVAATFNTTSVSQGISLSGSTFIKVARAGTYKIAVSPQLQLTTGTNTLVHLWLKKNGTNVDDSGSKVRLQGNNAETLPFVEFILPLSANDALEWYFVGDNGNSELHYEAASAPVPAIPSIVTNIYQL